MGTSEQREDLGGDYSKGSNSKRDNPKGHKSKVNDPEGGYPRIMQSRGRRFG